MDGCRSVCVSQSTDWFSRTSWGNSGPQNGIYWLKFVGEVFGASHGAGRGDPGCTFMYKVSLINQLCEEFIV